MRTSKKYSFLLITLIAGSFSYKAYAQIANQAVDNSNLTQYVDPYIGTAAHGHVFLGANVPFGAVQLGPTNLSQGWDWCSGYNYSDSTITGFSHTHLSGTGIGDLGDISVMPVTNEVNLNRGIPGDQKSGYYSLFSHEDEIVKPGYYSVKLKRYNIKAELTTSKRVGFHKYTFPANDDSKIIIDLKLGIGWDKSTDTYIKMENDTTISGYRYSKGWAPNQRVYFTAVFSKPIVQFTVFDSTARKQGHELKAEGVKGIAKFDLKNGGVVQLKVAISPVSIKNAKLNLKAEISGWDFDSQVKKADEAWNNELQKIQIASSTRATMKTFYTSLYHTMIAPSVFNDVNGDYRGADDKVYRNSLQTNYTTFSLWDTYRAAHPLFTLINADKAGEMINTMLHIYKQQGKLPVWHLMGNETNTMVGNPAIPVIADAYLKGISGFDKDLAYQAMKETELLDERGLYFVKKYGYIPADSTIESVAMGLEFAIADWSIAQIAKDRNNLEDYAYWDKRGRNYQNYFDRETKFMRGRLTDEAWRTPFNPFKAAHMNDDFTEGNAWQYLWLVPHDVEGLMSLLGGREAFVRKLDSLFIVTGDLGMESSPDISGLIGQYAHGNEPSHHIAYLYNYAAEPYKTANRVREIMEDLYTDEIDGLCGNEDVGQMSAWYVFSAMGFYPVNPANGMYVFGSPIIDKANIKVGSNKTFNILVEGNSKQNKYIQSIKLNGKDYTKSFISHSEIIKGGEIIIKMGDIPSRTWGKLPADIPYSSPWGASK